MLAKICGAKNKVSRPTIEGLYRERIYFLACRGASVRAERWLREVDRQNFGLLLFVFEVNDLTYHEHITNTITNTSK